MANQITNYQCPSCMGPLHFVGESGMLECDYCSGRYSVEEIEKLYGAAEEPEQPVVHDLGDDREETEWDFSGLSDDWGGDEVKMREYTCPSCGAQLVWEESTAAGSCPYCGNPTVAGEQFSGMLKPDYVIPFELSFEDAKKGLKDFYKGKRLLPAGFINDNKISEIQGVYVPFWLYDGTADADVTFDATITETYRDGDYDVTTVEHYDAHRSGIIPFEKIPVDASKKMPDEHMDAIEPFDYSKIKPFSMSYLPGYLAERYGHTAKQSKGRADKRAVNTAVDVLRSELTGYGGATVKSQNIYLERGKVSYALLPVYLLATKYDGKDYLFAMNGQTGKFVGELPVCKKKYWTYFLSIFAGVTGVLGTLMFIIL